MARKPRLGKLPPRYRFGLNPFPEVRWARCPRCQKLTFSRKFPLLIAIEAVRSLVALGITCRYCAKCEFIVAHQHEVEEELAILFTRKLPEAVGSDYVVLGVVESATWKKSLDDPVGMEELLAHTADIKDHYDLSDPRPRLVGPTS